MPEEYIGKREFDGFGGAVREEFKQLRGDLTQVSAKIDMLLNGRIEEARVIGEISGEIRAINQRLERQERETAELRRLQETEVANLRGEIGKVQDEQMNHTKGNVSWFMQLGMLIIAAIVGGIITKAWK